MIKYIHSLWSTPSTINNFDNKYDIKYLTKNFYSYLFSVLLIKKLGYKIELYCDKDAYDIYSLIPYDNIHLVDFDNDGVDSKFWIYGKIKTHTLINEPYIHIDGDVFMFRDIIGNKLDNGEYSAVVQSVEDSFTIGDSFNNMYSASLNPYVKYTRHGIDWDKYDLTAYNCGVIGFNDMNLKNMYADKVKNILCDISKDIDFNENRKKYDGMFLIAEQSLLYYILQENNIKPLEILKYEDMINDVNWSMNLGAKMGYTHMWSYSKYRDDVIQQIKIKINNFFPEYYKVIQIFEKIYLDK